MFFDVLGFFAILIANQSKNLLFSPKKELLLSSDVHHWAEAIETMRPTTDQLGWQSGIVGFSPQSPSDQKRRALRFSVEFLQGFLFQLVPCKKRQNPLVFFRTVCSVSKPECAIEGIRFALDSSAPSQLHLARQDPLQSLGCSLEYLL